MTVELVWVTPDAERMIADIARVSSPKRQGRDPAPLLLALMAHGHWSPFEMASMCVEIRTTRDVSRQILRHRSFQFQEFCVAEGTRVTLDSPCRAKRGGHGAYTRPIEHLFSLQERGYKLPVAARVYDEGTRLFTSAPIRRVYKTGVKPVFSVTFGSGKTVVCTKEHRFLTPDGFMSLEEAAGLGLQGGKAYVTKPDAVFGSNGVPAYRDKEALLRAKELSIADGTGLKGIAAKLNVNVDTLRDNLKKHGLQFTKAEVARYTSAWNKGKSGYKLKPHSPQTIAKMRASARKGSASNLWRGGVDRKERLRIADWCATLRTDFLREAGYACARCGGRGKLELHHIKAVSEHPELAYDPTNIEVLCPDCHAHHHNTSGERKLWRAKHKGHTLTVTWSKIASVTYVGERATYDLEVDHPSHNYVADGMVVHNSQRWSPVTEPAQIPVCRMQNPRARELPLECEDGMVAGWWDGVAHKVAQVALRHYEEALAKGVSREVARALLPEGLTPTRLYVSGTFRSWIHYLQLRLKPDTQKEHRDVAREIQLIFAEQAPTIWSAACC